MQSTAMNPVERRSVLALAGIYMLRMLGLFMVLPVFALYAGDYSGYTPALAGLAVGAYGLTQALLQVPLGLLSDRIGRKPVIAGGLLLFAAGSMVAALADDMHGLIAGRALQGAGAIAAAVMALTADLTRDEQRTKAMAGIGASIGLAFGAAMVLGPALAGVAGLAGVFWTTAAMAAAGLLVLLVVPAPARPVRQVEAVPVLAQFGRVLADGQLLRLDAGIFLLHMTLTATFVALPLELRDAGGLAPASHWMAYLGVMLASILVMVPFVILSERRGHLKAVLLGAIATLALSLGLLGQLSFGLAGLLGLVVLFFAAVNVLEALLPSLVSRVAPAAMKGTALGVYSSSQFGGAFLGGVLGGWVHGAFGLQAVFTCSAGVALAWLMLAFAMRTPEPVARRLLRVGDLSAEQAGVLRRRLASIPGVREAVVAEDGVAYLKVARAELDEELLRSVAAEGGR